MQVINLIKIATLSLAFSQALSMHANATNHSSMVWTYHQYEDALNNGRITSQFQVGVPQTDNIVTRGTCAVGSGGSFSTVLFGANIPQNRIGNTFSIRFNTSSGPKIKQGVAVGSDYEESISGIEIAINNDDLIWRSMANMNALTYVVSGQTYTLPLRGSGRTIASFLHDCNFYATQSQNQLGTQNAKNNQSTFTNKKHLTNDATKKPTDEPFVIKTEEAIDPRWASCDLLQDEFSKKSDFPVKMTVINKTDSHRAVMWIDFKGNPKEYASLETGETFTINTYVSHPWMFTDGPGNCLEMFMPHQGVDTFNITAVNRDFGPE